MAEFDLLNAAIPSYYGVTPDDSEGDKPFRVLGIALVVDQKGKEAKMVFRYPTMMPWEHFSTSATGAGTEDDSSDTIATAATDDLFFRLPPRQIAKLFRPKPTLCGQAMTLSVGGTVFCCRAVIIKDTEEEDQGGGDMRNSIDINNNNNNNTTTNDASSSGRVELFSLIVALVPRVHGSAIPITGLVEERKDVMYNNKDASMDTGSGKAKTTADCITITKETRSFLCVRRVHVSLTRICRILEREERRCRYVSLQTDFYSQIRRQTARPVGGGAGAQAAHNIPGITSPAATTSARPRRTNSFSSVFDRDIINSAMESSSSVINPHHHRKNSGRGGASVSLGATSTKYALSQWEEAEREQEILETVMAATPLRQALDSGGFQHQGNMARELVQFYHALARNDNDFPPSPSLLLTGRDGIVHVNQHIAVAIEAVTPSRIISQETRPLVRPYHTLLFPKASQKALLESLSPSGSTAPRRLQQLLLSVSPQKSLTEISVDANLSQQTTMEIATYLVGQGACVTSFVVSRNSRLACKSVAMIHKISLAFSQAFGSDVNLFVLVGFFTNSGWKLGEAISAMTFQENDSPAEQQQQQQQQQQQPQPEQQQHPSSSTAAQPPPPPPEMSWLRAQLVASLPPARRTQKKTATSASDTAVQDDCDPRLHQLEDVLFQMAVWLCAHRVLVHLQDYLVATSLSPPSSAGATNESGGGGGVDGVDRFVEMASADKRTDYKQQQHQQYSGAMLSYSMVSKSSILSVSRHNHNVESNSSGGAASILNSGDEILFRELQEAACLTGNVSVPACCWRLGIESGRLRAFAHRYEAYVRIISRVAEPTDDWAAA